MRYKLSVNANNNRQLLLLNPELAVPVEGQSYKGVYEFEPVLFEHDTLFNYVIKKFQNEVTTYDLLNNIKYSAELAKMVNKE